MGNCYKGKPNLNKFKKLAAIGFLKLCPQFQPFGALNFIR